MVHFSVLKRGVRFRPAMVVVLTLAATALTAFSLVGCKEKTAGHRLMDDPKFKTWLSSTYDNVRLFYPPNHPHEANFESIAQGYRRAEDQVRQILAIDSLPDTLTVFYFTGPNQGLEFTGQARPFADTEAVYYWPNYSRGVSLTKYLLKHWSRVEPTNVFLKHGLIALFDFAGENYHKTTIDYTNDTLYIPLAKLAVDTAINSDVERYQSAEAASFVAFVLADYSPLILKRLYESPEPFNSIAPQILGKPLDTIEQQWLEFARSNVPASGTNP